MSIGNFLGSALSFTGVGLLASAISANEVAATNQAALLRSEQLKTQTLSKQYAQSKGRGLTIDEMHKSLSAQQAINYNRGLSGSSPSFNAIQMSTYNRGAQVLQNSQIDSHLTALSRESGLLSIEAQRKSHNEQAYWSAFTNVVQLGAKAAGAF